MSNGDCPVGSANRTAIEALTGWQKRQDDAMDKQTKRLDALNGKMDKFSDNMNRILGGIAIACVLLVVNIILMSTGGG
jgi:hypothetical protein